MGKVEHNLPRESRWGEEINPQHGSPSKQTQRQATSKAGQVVGCRVYFLNQRAAFKTELPHLAGDGPDKTGAAKK
jgi:hypothetical protein